MKRILLFLIMTLLLLPLPVLAVSYDGALTCSSGSATLLTLMDKDDRIYKISWISHASNGNLACTIPFPGYIMIIDTDPGATAPDANYDFTLPNGAGVDVFEGDLANRHTSTSERIKFTDLPRLIMGGDTILTGANMGNSKVGDIYFYIWLKQGQD